ncbi:hypothetical protein C4552_00650 [Candidatus Parcubacteria bacterium]|nr:MAG: hypothetical protein C4552_00650 [Candidatus Parcubacteria bacterium]
MTATISDNLKILLAVAILLGVGFIWYMYIGPILDAPEAVYAETVIDPENLRRYRRLNAASFNLEFFTGPEFRGLQSPPLTATSSLPAGRPNPFAPF